MRHFDRLESLLCDPQVYDAQFFSVNIYKLKLIRQYEYQYMYFVASRSGNLYLSVLFVSAGITSQNIKIQYISHNLFDFCFVTDHPPVHFCTRICYIHLGVICI